MNRRNAVRIISFSLSIVLVCVISNLKIRKEKEQYAREIGNSYNFMLNELGTAANNIATILNKTRFVTTAKQVSNMAAQLLTEAEISKNALSQLPAGEELKSLKQFFSQVGNYAMSVSQSLLKDENITDQDIANIERLSDISKKVAKTVNETKDKYDNLEYWAEHLERKLDDILENNGLSESISVVEDEFNDYPKLIYDGPYSNHILERKPIMLQNKEKVERDTAVKIAAKWAQVSTDNLKYSGTTEGKIPTYNYSGEDHTVAVTQNGGYVLYMRREKDCNDIKLSYEQALHYANAYLKYMGMDNLKETYYYESDGICTINFAYLGGDVLCYTDLIKVGVSMDNGEIVLYEAGGYLTNHAQREKPTLKHSATEAQKLLSSKLSVENTRLAIIPTPSVDEKLCYEFTCTSADGQEVLIYINTATLEEEEILVLLKDDGGILVK